ncbi:MAG TPA: hypothetical protein VKH44_06060, partial [Pirellulaceae bacterium]|nr:hypothetical protein [Pirellulaceae bacterium]
LLLWARASVSRETESDSDRSIRIARAMKSAGMTAAAAIIGKKHGLKKPTASHFSSEGRVFRPTTASFVT